MDRTPLALTPPFGPAVVSSAAEDRTVTLFTEGRTVAIAAAIGAQAEEWLAETGDQVRRRLPLARPLACAPECTFCCHVKVLVSAIEVVRLVTHLRATKSDGELAALRMMIGAVDVETRGLTMAERAASQVACPLLSFNRCTAYEARPLACRGANSYDAAACEAAFDAPAEDRGVPVYKPDSQLAHAVREGLCAATSRWGLDGRIFELNAALKVALDQPEILDAWAAGEPALAEALDPEIDAMIRAVERGHAPG